MGWEVGALGIVGYFGRYRTGRVVKVGRSRVTLRIVMPSNGKVWVKTFPGKKVLTQDQYAAMTAPQRGAF
jgi:hypothetical protein